jgi:hypothetical protein
MAILFPTSLDTFSAPTPGQMQSVAGADGRTHSKTHEDLGDAVEALQVKVGITASADTGSLDYKVAQRALDSAVVHLSGSETVTGTKTFTARQAIDLGTGALPTPDDATCVLQLGATDSAPNIIEGVSYTSSGLGFNARSASGTRASPSALGSGSAILNMVVRGYDGSSWSGVRGRYQITSGSVWSGSNHETEHRIWGTPSGSVTTAEWGRWKNAALLIGATALVSAEGLRVAAGTAPATVTGGSTLAGAGTVATPSVIIDSLRGTTATVSTTGTIAALASGNHYTRLTGAAPDVQGIAAPTNNAGRLVLYFVNATTLRHENASASAANRITCHTGADIVVAAGKTVELIYDPTSTRWRTMSY